MDSQHVPVGHATRDVDAVMTCKLDWLKFSTIAESLSVEKLDEFEAPEGFTLLLCKKEEISHKHQAIHLFTLATILRLNFNADCLIWEYSRFHNNLKNDLLDQVGSKPVVPTPELGEGLILDSSIQLHLQQSGFTITPQSENQKISNDQLRTFLAEISALKLKVAA